MEIIVLKKYKLKYLRYNTVSYLGNRNVIKKGTGLQIN